MTTKKTLLCLKIGGSVITDKKVPYTAQLDTIRAIAKILATVRVPLLISHGSGSFGHTSAQIHGGQHGYKSRLGFAIVAYDASAINTIVTKILVEEGIPAISFRPMSFLHSKNGQIKEAFYSPIEQSLTDGFVPVVYGDVIFDQTWKSTIFSGETLMTLLCTYFHNRTYSAIKIIELCNVDGVLDPHGVVISSITQHTWEQVKKYMKRSGVIDVTGGMEHKVMEALTIARSGITTTIVSGNDPEQLQKVLNGEAVGTIIS